MDLSNKTTVSIGVITGLAVGFAISGVKIYRSKYFNDRFLDQYSDINKIEKNEYFSYEFIYQIYFSLININTWNRAYIKDLNNMLKNIRL